jgi:hypothetical protein
MNGNITKILVALATAALAAMGSILWGVNERLAVLDERVSRLLVHSDRNDEAMDKRIRELEQRLK